MCLACGARFLNWTDFSVDKSRDSMSETMVVNATPRYSETLCFLGLFLEVRDLVFGPTEKLSA